jgi:BTB/POZ domain
MDLGVFQPAVAGTTGGDSSVAEHQSATRTTAKWRLPPDESFSDWTVEVLVDRDDDRKDTVAEPVQKKRKTGTVYHVHKERLGSGPRGSSYFAKVFRSDFSEVSTQTSTVYLPPKTAECFPVLLDFVYNESSNVIVDSPASAAAIRYLANYFGIKQLFDNVNATYISSNMSSKTVLDYFYESIRYGDESLGEAATQRLIKVISNYDLNWTDAMANLPLYTLLKIAEQVKRNINVSHIIIEYIKSGVQRVTSKIVANLFDKYLHPRSIEKFPFAILQLVERYKLPADHSARQACIKTIGALWSKWPHPPRGFPITYATLSDGLKVEILERSLGQANDDLKKLKTPQRNDSWEAESLSLDSDA